MFNSESEIAVERHSVLRPYRSRPMGLICPSTSTSESIDEGEHNVPRVFEASLLDMTESDHHHSIPQLFIVASRNSFSRPTRPNTAIVPRQIESHQLTDESMSLSEDSEGNEEEILGFYGEDGLWRILEEVPRESVLLMFVKVLAYYNSGDDRARELVEYLEQMKTNSEGIATVMILSILQDFYLKSDSSLFLQLKRTYEKWVEFFSKIENFTTLHEQIRMIKGYSTLEIKDLDCQEEYVGYYKEKILEIIRNTGGLTKDMFLL